MERFCFDYEATDGDLFVQVWDSGLFFINEFLGEVKIATEPFLKLEKRKTFKLVHNENLHPGSIDLSIFLCPPGYFLEEKEV